MTDNQLVPRIKWVGLTIGAVVLFSAGVIGGIHVGLLLAHHDRAEMIRLEKRDKEHESSFDAIEGVVKRLSDENRRLKRQVGR